MARSGRAQTGLNPFGNQATDLGKYDIAGTLANLDVYAAEVGWGNGTVTDADYLAALQKAIDATDPETRARITAVNAKDDAVYRIGRAAANQTGLDALIAFDQRSLVTMNPDNLRYRGIADSLSSELAQRRSRDYGNRVSDLNAGKTTTAAVLAWVNQTIAALPADAPDKDAWANAKKDLLTRAQSETDAKVYQDYQHQRIKGDAFLAYIKGRRDSFTPGSPDYLDWSNKLEDATKNVRDTALSKQDNAFFNAYQAGHKTDKQYLAYLSDRVHGMDASDPERAQWEARLRAAAFSTTEDELRFKVTTAKSAGAQAAAISALRSFYTHYRNGLVPNSPEYRRVTSAILSMGGSAGSGGGGGSRGGGSKSKTGGSKSQTAISAALGGGPGTTTRTNHGLEFPASKVIHLPTTLTSIVKTLTIDPTKKGAKGAYSYLLLNHDSLMNAIQRGDDTWTYVDPNDPRKRTQLPTSGDALAELDALKGQYWAGVAALAYAHHDSKGFATASRTSINAYDDARLHAGQAFDRAVTVNYNQTKQLIDTAMKLGDWATVINESRDLLNRLADDKNHAGLDDTRKAEIDKMAEAIASNKLLPKVDLFGNTVNPGAIDQTRSTFDANGNVIDAVLNDGWHHVLDHEDPSGTQKWDLVFDDGAPGTWDTKPDGTPNHVAVYTQYGPTLVLGEVTVKPNAPVSPQVVVQTPHGEVMMESGGETTAYIGFIDEHGDKVSAYSLDGGNTWVKPDAGSLPQIQFDGQLTEGDVSGVDAQGNIVRGLFDAGGNVVATLVGDGTPGGTAWVADPHYQANHAESFQWFNQRQAEKSLREAQSPAGQRRQDQARAFSLATGKPVTTTVRNADGTHSVGVPVRNIDGNWTTVGMPVDGVGAPGQHMSIITIDPQTGVVNLLQTPASRPRNPLDNLLADERPGHQGVAVAGIEAAGFTAGARPGFTDTLASVGRPGDNRLLDAWTQLPATTPPVVSGVGFGSLPTPPLSKINEALPKVKPAALPTVSKPKTPLALAKGSTPTGPRNIDIIEGYKKPSAPKPPTPLTTAKGIGPSTAL